MVKAIYLYTDGDEDHNVVTDLDDEHQYDMTTPPWEDELNMLVYGHRKYGQSGYGAHAVWPVNSEQTNIQQNIADFYLLDAIVNHAMVPTPGHPMTPLPSSTLDVMVEMLIDGETVKVSESDEMPGIQARAAHRYATLLGNLAPVVHNYMHYAISTELYFHGACHRLGDIPLGWHAMVQRFGSGRCARWAAEVFRDDGWSESYGGEPWAVGCDVLAAFDDGEWYGQHFGRREFLDRAFALQHNGGSYLNKCGWKEGLSGLEYLLDAHHASDWNKLAKRASEFVVGLMADYWDVANKMRDAEGYEPLAAPKFLSGKVKSSPVQESSSYQKPKVEAPKPLLAKVKVMEAKYAGKCRVSGKMFPAGSQIVWHGKGKGASILSEWEALRAKQSGKEPAVPLVHDKGAKVPKDGMIIPSGLNMTWEENYPTNAGNGDGVLIGQGYIYGPVASEGFWQVVADPSEWSTGSSTYFACHKEGMSGWWVCEEHLIDFLNCTGNYESF